MHVNDTGGEDVSLEIHNGCALGGLDLASHLHNDALVNQQIALEPFILAIKDVSVLEQSGCSAVDEAGVQSAGLCWGVDVLVLATDLLTLGLAVQEVTSRDTGALEVDLVVGEFVGGAEVVGRGGEEGDGSGGEEEGALLAVEGLLWGLLVGVADFFLVVLRQGCVIRHCVFFVDVRGLYTEEQRRESVVCMDKGWDEVR